MADGALPGVLYHYQPGRIDWLCRMFVQSEIRLSDPSKLNDPWDCKPIFDDHSEYTDEQRRAIVIDLWDRGEVRFSNDNDMKDTLLVNCSDSEFSKLLSNLERSASSEMQRNFVIYCLSDRADAGLLWSHYADRHRGICLGFSFGTPIIDQAIRVRYVKSLIKIQIGMDIKDIGRAAYLTKSSAWKYEREWRALIRRNPSGDSHQTCPEDPLSCFASAEGYCGIDLKGLVSITFGLNSTPWERQAIQQLARTHGWTGYFQEAIKSRNDYKLTIRDLPA